MTRRSFPGTVGERLSRKLEFLERCIEGEIPAGVQIPRTLKSFAAWQDKTLGLYPVGSPNDVTMTHPKLGEFARKAQAALDEINTEAERKTKRKRRPTLSEENARLRTELAQSRARDRNLMGQFHMKDAACDRLRREAASMEARIHHLTEQNRLLLTRIRRLEAVRVLHTNHQGLADDGDP